MDLVIEKLVPGGDGLARVDGKVVFVPGGLPGEKIRARITEVRKDFSRGEIETVLEPSPERVTPPCPVAGRCGGCDWQHLGYAEQLRQKLALAADALRRIGGLEFPGLRIEAGNPWGYRNRLQLHRRGDGRAGFSARASHEIIPVDGCPVAHPALGALLAALPAGKPGAPSLARYPVWAHTAAGGAHVVADGSADPAREIAVDILGKAIRFDLRCFFQSNVAMLEKLIPYALEGLDGDEAMDLYCGVGLFGAFLADRCRRVLAVEENGVSLEWARRNLGVTGGHRFLQGRIEDLAARGALRGGRPEAVVVDPPRAGLETPVRDFLAAARPRRIAYVSCNPVTLARDLKDLLARGFVLEDMRLFDFYPQTAHIEAVARLARAPQ